MWHWTVKVLNLYVNNPPSNIPHTDKLWLIYLRQMTFPYLSLSFHYQDRTWKYWWDYSTDDRFFTVLRNHLMILLLKQVLDHRSLIKIIPHQQRELYKVPHKYPSLTTLKFSRTSNTFQVTLFIDWTKTGHSSSYTKPLLMTIYGSPEMTESGVLPNRRILQRIH